jgi:hypothetical protein
VKSRISTRFATINRCRSSSRLVALKGWLAMIENNFFTHEHLAYDRRRCPHCTALSRLTHSFLDTRNGNRVHVYQCGSCGKRTWDEGTQPFARLQ